MGGFDASDLVMAWAIGMMTMILVAHLAGLLEDPEPPKPA